MVPPRCQRRTGGWNPRLKSSAGGARSTKPPKSAVAGVIAPYGPEGEPLCLSVGAEQPRPVWRRGSAEMSPVAVVWTWPTTPRGYVTHPRREASKCPILRCGVGPDRSVRGGDGSPSCRKPKRAPPRDPRMRGASPCHPPAIRLPGKEGAEHCAGRDQGPQPSGRRSCPPRGGTHRRRRWTAERPPGG